MKPAQHIALEDFEADLDLRYKRALIIAHEKRIPSDQKVFIATTGGTNIDSARVSEMIGRWGRRVEVWTQDFDAEIMVNGSSDRSRFYPLHVTDPYPHPFVLDKAEPIFIRSLGAADTDIIFLFRGDQGT